jgi:serine/threonine protein kinase
MSDAERLLEVAAAVCGENGLTLIGSVGAGVFKQTFHVTTADGGSMALKVYNSNNRNARVEREVEAMSRCAHPNIAKFDVLATFGLNGTEYLYSLEEFIAGGSLEARLADGKLERADVISIGVQLVNAVSHIAGHDLVHRDLKPANIMLREGSSSPVVVDFGLVRNLEATSLTETWIPQGPGTPLFAPPEQLNNEKHLIDWRADQFALGVVFTMCITARHPYQDESEQPFHAVERVASRGSLPAWFPEWANKQNLGPLYRMVQPWPVQRYRLAGDLVAAWQALE